MYIGTHTHAHAHGHKHKHEHKHGHKNEHKHEYMNIKINTRISQSPIMHSHHQMATCLVTSQPHILYNYKYNNHARNGSHNAL